MSFVRFGEVGIGNENSPSCGITKKYSCSSGLLGGKSKCYIKKMNYQQCSMCSFSRIVFSIRFNYSLSGKPQFLEMH